MTFFYKKQIIWLEILELTQYGFVDKFERSCKGFSIYKSNFLIYDASYDEEEYLEHEGWGHSTALMIANVANKTKIKKLFMTHHSPTATDAKTQKKLIVAKNKFANSFLGHEGLKSIYKTGNS